jgi:hypothetical protein
MFRGVKRAIVSEFGLGLYKLGSYSTQILNEAFREHEFWLKH